MGLRSSDNRSGLVLETRGVCPNVLVLQLVGASELVGGFGEPTDHPHEEAGKSPAGLTLLTSWHHLDPQSCPLRRARGSNLERVNGMIPFGGSWLGKTSVRPIYCIPIETEGEECAYVRLGPSSDDLISVFVEGALPHMG